MIKFAREFRLIPIVLLATVCLLALKVSGIVIDGGYTLGDRLRDRGSPPGMTVTAATSVPDYPRIVVAGQPAPLEAPAAPGPWAKEMFNFGGKIGGTEPEVTGSVAGKRASEQDQDIEIVTGSSAGAAPKPEAGPPLKSSESPPPPTKLEVGGDAYPLNPGNINSPGERAILGRLQDRRETLEGRTRELDMRENLIKAAEKRLEAKVSELKEIEARIKVATETREKSETERFSGIVAMYETMKPKDAARIFDRLDIKVLVDVSTALKPRTMSAILSQMTPEAAEKLTMELASRPNGSKSQNPDELPKIESRPGNS